MSALSALFDVAEPLFIHAVDSLAAEESELHAEVVAGAADARLVLLWTPQPTLRLVVTGSAGIRQFEFTEADLRAAKH